MVGVFACCRLSFGCLRFECDQNYIAKQRGNEEGQRNKWARGHKAAKVTWAHKEERKKGRKTTLKEV